MKGRLELIFFISGLAALVFSPFTLFAQEKTARKAARTINVISGEVSAISKDFIAIVYGRNAAKGSEEEIALPIAKDVIIEHKKNLSEIGAGDTVDVEYEEISEETKEGTKSKRVAKVVSFVRAAPAPKPKSSVLVSGAVQEEEEKEQ